MKCHRIAIVVVAVTFIAPLGGCTSDRGTSAQPVKQQQVAQVTAPNGSSPAKANAAHAPMNDTDAMRSGWNHGNGALWVSLPDEGKLHLSDMNPEKDGTHRLKFGWWRGHAGKFSVEGRRLDAPAPPLRYSAKPESYGAFGFLPSYLYFPSEGLWEITGHLDDKTLTFVVQVVQ
jgi:hypothetical protein